MGNFRIKQTKDKFQIEKQRSILGILYWDIYEEDYWYAHSKDTYDSEEECREKLKNLGISNDQISTTT